MLTSIYILSAVTLSQAIDQLIITYKENFFVLNNLSR